MDNIVGSSYVKPTPVFSFNSIIDEDVSLIRYVALHYNDPSIFDFSHFLDEDFSDVIKKIYYREEENPLKLYTVEGVNESFLDECYHEFLETKEEEILQYGVLTEIPDLISMYDQYGGISPSLFYYNDLQLEILDQIEEFQYLEKIHYTKVSNNKYSQIYLKDYREAEKFTYLRTKTFYFSSSEINVNALNHLEDIEFMRKIAENRNHISIYDLYGDSISRDNHVEEGEETE